MDSRLTAALGLLAVLGLLAGCSAAGSLDMRAVNATELADEASRSYAPEPAVHYESDRPPWEIVDAAVENGSTTVTAVSAPIDEGLPFAQDGAYYDLSRTVVGEEQASVVTVRIDYDASEPNGTAVDYADLPPADRAALTGLLPQQVPTPPDDTDVGVGAVYTDAELNSSVLAPTQQYDVVVFEGERYPVTVEEPRSVTVQTYRYTATQVAPNASAYAEQVREASLFELSDLSEAERSVVEEAVDSGAYYADSDDDRAFAAVVDLFRAHDAIREDQASGRWLVRYDGTVYVADLHFGGFLGE